MKLREFMNYTDVQMIKAQKDYQKYKIPIKVTLKKFKVFLSYSSLDYELAKEIKNFLEVFGLNVFLAHTSIEPSLDWVEEIHKNLNDCDIFIPLLTEAFKESNWTDQESGIAYSFKKIILPIKIDLDPYGFLSKFQAFRLDTKKMNWEADDSRVKLVEKIINFYFNRMREPLVLSLEKTPSWIIGETKFKILKEMEKKEPFTKEEINHIMSESIMNSQIHGASGVKPYLKELVERYEKKIEPFLKEKMMKILEPKILRKKNPSLVNGLKKHL